MKRKVTGSSKPCWGFPAHRMGTWKRRCPPFRSSPNGTCSANGAAEQTDDREKSVRVTIRVAPEVEESLQRQAKELGICISAYIALLAVHHTTIRAVQRIDIRLSQDHP